VVAVRPQPREANSACSRSTVVARHVPRSPGSMLTRSGMATSARSHVNATSVASNGSGPQSRRKAIGAILHLDSVPAARQSKLCV
jgi:hypothetical protein